MRLDRLVKAVVDALEDIKGRDIVVLDVRRMTALFDKVIVVSGDSTRQNKALATRRSRRSGCACDAAGGAQPL
jgi:ribosome-associated protein